MKGLILHPTYRLRRGRPVVHLFGRLEDGPAFLVEDDRVEPWFWIPADEAHRAHGEPGVRVETSGMRGLDGQPVARVVVTAPRDVPPLRERLQRSGVVCYESDVRFAALYLMERGLRTGVEIEGEPKARRDGLLRFANPTLRPAEVRPKLRVLSIDLETTPDARRILSAALVGDDVDEVHWVGDRELPAAIAHESEPALLRAVNERIRALDPDVLTGWNVVDFDLNVWLERCHAHALAARLGRDDQELQIQRDRSFTRQARATVAGRMVLDGLELVRGAVRLPDYRLETAARSLLGRGKLIEDDVPDRAAEIQRLYREDPAALVDYNREDARLVLDILERESLLELTIERSLLGGMPLDRVGGSIATFDLAYLPELHRRGYVAPSVAPDRKSAPVRGGAVLDSEPGLFRDVALFDFKSLYPSLIRTFNLDPVAHAEAEDDEDAITAPNGARFARREGILPGVIDRYMERREAAKARGDHHADQAIKIMMNSMFGVLGAASCRFFDPAIANAITHFGQQTLSWTREAFEATGVRVLYGDTDSVFVELPQDEAPDAAAARLRERVARGLEARVRTEYGVEPRLELELERIYSRWFMPRVRRGRDGSKKRYAGWCRDHLEVVGLESVRRDTPALGKHLQQGLLERIFTDREVLPFVRELVTELREGNLDRDLVYRKGIRKGSLDRYTATTPPHVQAARKAGDAAGNVIRYVITQTGPEPVLPGRPFPERVDRGHYEEKLLRPIADAILVEVGTSFDEAIGAPRQMTLL